MALYYLVRLGFFRALSKYFGAKMTQPSRFRNIVPRYTPMITVRCQIVHIIYYERPAIENQIVVNSP